MRTPIATVQVDMLDDGTYAAVLRRDGSSEAEEWSQGESIPEALSLLADAMLISARHEFDARRPRP